MSSIGRKEDLYVTRPGWPDSGSGNSSSLPSRASGSRNSSLPSWSRGSGKAPHPWSKTWLESRQRETRRTIYGPVGWNGVFPASEGPICPPGVECIDVWVNPNYTPKPGGEYQRITMINLSGSYSVRRPPSGLTFIFVQGKESACIVTRDLGKDKIHNLRMHFIGLADVRLGKSVTIGHALDKPAELHPDAVVSVFSNPDDLNEEKGSKTSSHKESGSRPLNEEAAFNFLKQKLEHDGFKETIVTAISALQCLYQENVKADEIEVYTADVDQTHTFLSRGEIEMHLASSST